MTAMRRADELDAETRRVVARRLVRPLPDNPTVVDVGSGTGGMAAALVEALAARGGGTVVLVDAVPELLDAATSAARAAATNAPPYTGTTPPGSAGPGSAGPGSVGPGSAGPGSAGPGSAGPGSAGPGSAGPGSAGHGSAGLNSAGFASTGPGGTGPGGTGPGGTGPGGIGPGGAGPGGVRPASGRPGSARPDDTRPRTVPFAGPPAAPPAGSTADPTAARPAGPPSVRVRPVLADLATERPVDIVGTAHLVWAAGVVHHVPDQRKAVTDLVDALAPGGWLALGEGGLESRFLPWDLGVGEPGLADRLSAARAEWYVRMRESMAGSVRLPVGWNIVLAEAGLVDVTAFSYLIDHPAPAEQAVRESAAARLAWLAEVTRDRLHPADRHTVARLLDPQDPAYVGLRDDVFLLAAGTVHLGRKS
ncbi:methyltransferase domain-containing protein [Saccharothrix algeriensis]|uniref:SAM-dependent methyltransferase n=1 Tax=Saccharothrix algeriensis TaxID=173560 RepID=A0ABS2S4X5_9PSEU|nr:SAM-dependent methyltransferase [Saccharothrix algeriensis]